MDRQPRWIADEMVGRLARYLRFLGHDTVYARGLADSTIVRMAADADRVLLTRDRDLARRVTGSLLLRSPQVREQVLAVRAAHPEVSWEVRFDRCTECNGPLQPWHLPVGSDWPPDLPVAVAGSGREIFACSECGHRYWEGSHTARIRSELAAWFAAEADP